MCCKSISYKNNNMTERETLKLLQIGVLTNIIPYNMDKKTPPPPTADAQRFVVTSPENFFFFFLTY